MMDIPKHIRQAIILKEQELREKEYLDFALKLAKMRPACWKQLGEISKNHAHTPDGKCITKNWSNEEAKGNWRKAK